MSKEIKLNLAANLIGLVAPFIGRGDIRYYLDGINVRPAKGGGAIIAATNGHALAMALDRSAVCEEEVTLRVNGHLLQACAAMPVRDQRRLEMRGGRLAVTLGQGENSDLYIQAGNPVIDGKYPNIFNVVPDPEKLTLGMAGAFTSVILDKANQATRHAMKLKGGVKYGAMQFWTPDSSRESCCVVRIDGFADWFAVLMPCRSELIENPTPQFVLDGMGGAK